METKVEHDINERVATLTPQQQKLLNDVIDAFKQPIHAKRSPQSDVVTEEFLRAFGDVLRLHHILSADYLDKHRFEVAMERGMIAAGLVASRPDNKCNPGHDITIEGVPWSLKTQGDKKIRRDSLHISKFMELGKGDWNNADDLAKLRDSFLAHMRSYERVFQLRHFKCDSSALMPAEHYYELIEIPKAVLMSAKDGTIEMSTKAKSNPKPGHCTVKDKNGKVQFKLYFDAGSERKLQIQQLRRDLCVFHASWEF